MDLAACTIPLLERIGRLQRLAKLHGQMQSQLQWQHAAAQVHIARPGSTEKAFSALCGRAARPDRCTAHVAVVGGLAATGSSRTSFVVRASFNRFPPGTGLVQLDSAQDAVCPANAGEDMHVLTLVHHTSAVLEQATAC